MSDRRAAVALTRTTWCAVWAVCAFIASAVAYATDAQGVWFLGGLAVALFLAILDLNMGLASVTSGWYVAWRAGMVAAWSIWCAAATAWAPWDTTIGIIGAVLAAAMVMLTPAVAGRADDAFTMTIGWSGREGEWRDRIRRITKLEVDTLDVTTWDTKMGYTIDGEFPEGGATWEDLAARTSRFASDLKLPDGCAVEIGMGAHQGAFRIDYSTKNAFAVSDDVDKDLTPMPDPQPGSIEDACPCGYLADGATATITDLRQESILLGGANGSGKSNAMRVICCWHVTRYDQVTYVIDLSAGRLGRPFINPYLKGKVKRPAIDGLADTPERAEALLTWLIDVIEDRPITYQALMDDADDDKLPVSADVPAIRLVIDEPKKIWANPRLAPLAAKVVESQETGRAMALRCDYTALGGTVNALPADLKKQVRHRISLRCSDTAEVAYILDWIAARVLNIRALARRGMAYIGAFEGPIPRLMRFWRVKPSGVEKVAIAAADIRPDIDEAAKRLPSYAAVADRWDWQRRPSTPAPEPVKEPAMATAATPPVPDPHQEFQAAQTQLGDVYERLKARRIELEAAQAGGGVAVATRPDITTAVAQYLTEHGETGTADLVDHLKTIGHPQTDNRLRELISGLADAGKITRSRHGFYEAFTPKEHL